MSANAHGNFRGKRLVVFGCGYVGSAVARDALVRGMQLTALTRNAAKAAALRADGIEVVVGDLATTAWHAAIGGEVDFALNCVSSGGAGLDGYRRSYVEGMRSVLEWANSRARVGTLVYTSSTAVYPQNDGAVVDECAAVGGSDRAEVLLAAEQLLRAPGATGLRWFVLRLAGIYGPGRLHLVNQVRAGEVSGRSEHHLNLAHRDDIAAAVWACFGASPEIKNEILNVADDGAARKADVVAWLAARLGKPVPRFTGVAAEGRAAVTPDRIVGNRKLKTLLGWRPRFPSFRAGYENMLSEAGK